MMTDSTSCKSDPTPAKTEVTRLYIAFQFFFDLLIWLPVFYEFQRRIGLATEQILFIQSLHYLSFVVFEVPTGYLADRFGYRHSLRWGALLFFVCNLFPIFTPTYTGMLTHFLLIALARSLISGAANAYLYEYLKLHNASDEYKKIEGQSRACGLVGRVASWAVVGFLMKWHLTLPYWVTALSGLAACHFAHRLPLLPWGSQLRHAAEKKSTQTGFADVLRHLCRSPMLVLLMLQAVVIFVFGRLQVTYFQPLLSEKKFDVVDFGWIMAAMTVFEAIGAFKARWLKKYITDINAVHFLCAALVLSFLGIALSRHSGTIAGFCVFGYFMGLIYPIQMQVLNDHITNSRHRATLLSIASLLGLSMSSFGIMLFSGIAAAGNFGQVFLFSALSGGVLILTLAGLMAFYKYTTKVQAM